MRTGKYLYLLFIILLACMIPSCSDNVRDSRFKDIERRIEADPEAAVRYVDSLNKDKVWKEGMNAAEWARFDLLRIKSADKAYVRHTSDSLIRTVLAYYEKHTGSEQYPEALYYGGRVYSDLGDSPTSLRYFQQALDALDKSENYRLKTKILSQAARLLTSRRLYTEAMPYIDKATEIEEREKDSLGLMYDLEFSGAIRMHAGKYDEAERCFRNSLSMARCLDSNFVVQNKMQLAAVRYYKKENDSALALIRHLPDINDKVLRRTILTYAADIYLRANILDTAYIYAKELLESPVENERKHGYQVILDSSLAHYVPRDSMQQYVREYRKIVEDNWNQSEDCQVQIQNSQFNYKLKEQKQKDAEAKVLSLSLWIILAGTGIIVLLLSLIWMRVRNRKQRIELLKANNDIGLLQKSICVMRESLGYAYDYSQKVSDVCSQEDKKEDISKRALKEELKKRLLELSQSSTSNYHVQPEILQSATYNKLIDYLQRGVSIPDNDYQLWDDLKKTVLEYNDKFLYHLNLLTGDEVRETHLRVCLLIKCGMTPTQMGILLGRTSGAISSRREQLCIRIFGKRMGNKVIDDIVRHM